MHTEDPAGDCPRKIRPARPDDVDTIVALIRELAVYEKLERQMEASAEALHSHLFAEPPACHVLVAVSGSADETSGPGKGIVGYAVYFPVYSTFKTSTCLYLEDLYVTPSARGKGFGRALFAAVAAEARARGCPRMDWSVLSWNRPAIDFYENLGAELLVDWRICRLEGQGLDQVAGLQPART